MLVCSWPSFPFACLASSLIYFFFVACRPSGAPIKTDTNAEQWMPPEFMPNTCWKDDLVSVCPILCVRLMIYHKFIRTFSYRAITTHMLTNLLLDLQIAIFCHLWTGLILCLPMLPTINRTDFDGHHHHNNNALPSVHYTVFRFVNKQIYYTFACH